jgi:transposase
MKKLRVTDTHGWTVETLKKYERTLNNASSLKRVMAVRFVMEGYQGLEVAALLHVHRQSVSTYVNHFNQGGIDKLLERKSAPGRSPYLSEAEEAEVKRWLIESTPAKEGFGPESYWDTRVLQHVLEERFHIVMSRNGITDMLHRWGFRYTRPTYRLKKADVEKQKHFQRDLDMVKKTSPMR